MYLTKWTDLSQSNLENQWPLWGTSEITKLDFLKTKLDNNSTVIKKEEWNAYFEWYIEASKQDHEFKIAHLENKVSKLTFLGACRRSREEQTLAASEL